MIVYRIHSWLMLTGEHRLAFGRMWSVERPRKKAKPHHPQRWQGGTAYNYGMEAPRYPVPAVWDAYPDAEYLLMLYQRALLEQQLRDMRGEKQQ